MDDKDIGFALSVRSDELSPQAADYIERLESDADLTHQALASIAAKLTEFGIDVSATPPMNYPEAIHNLRAGLLGQIRDLEAVARALDAAMRNAPAEELAAKLGTDRELVWGRLVAARSRVNLPELPEGSGTNGTERKETKR